MILRSLSALAVLTLVGCPKPHFVDQPVVWQVADSADIPLPEENAFLEMSYMSDVFVFRRSTRALGLPTRRAALGTNALDEVPDSNWFTNRIGVRDVSPEEAATGPMTGGPPELPLTVVGGKGGGGNPGFFAKDATGRVFLIKFDTKANPEQQTSAAVIVNRAFWTAGYFVPEDSVFEFSASDLSIDPSATMRDALGNKISLEQHHIDGVLATSPTIGPNRFRSTASQFLSGTPAGGLPASGVRKDDVNDTVPHEHRRELRGLKVLAAWLNHTDVKEDNTLDMWIEEDGRHFLRHYFIDFGETLGAHQSEKGRMEDGFEHALDWRENGKSLLALGLWKRPWEGQEQTQWPSIGAFAADHFHPKGWREAYPYWPFFEADPADLYWGAKLVMRFDRPVVEAIVAEGKLSDPAASAYLVDVLMSRRDKIGRVWLDGVTSLDDFEIVDGQLCATDLAFQYGVAAPGRVHRLGLAGQRDKGIVIGDDARVCVPLQQGAYVVEKLQIRRMGDRRDPVEVHYVGGPDPHIVGIVRSR